MPHVDDLLQLFPDNCVFLIADRASYHNSDAVRDFLNAPDLATFQRLMGSSPCLRPSGKTC